MSSFNFRVLPTSVNPRAVPKSFNYLCFPANDVAKMLEIVEKEEYKTFAIVYGGDFMSTLKIVAIEDLLAHFDQSCSDGAILQVTPNEKATFPLRLTFYHVDPSSSHGFQIYAHSSTYSTIVKCFRGRNDPNEPYSDTLIERVLAKHMMVTEK